ncbi:MAG: hypothetical protein JST00_04825 [Deltaproteobacteria bacterium]|nr:hypothetical protein [Deltaproteobacteria bacterium]
MSLADLYDTEPRTLRNPPREARARSFFERTLPSAEAAVIEELPAIAELPPIAEPLAALELPPLDEPSITPTLAASLGPRRSTLRLIFTLTMLCAVAFVAAAFGGVSWPSAQAASPERVGAVVRAPSAAEGAVGVSRPALPRRHADLQRPRASRR